MRKTLSNEKNKIKINPLDHPICYTLPLRLAYPWAWVEHIPFAMFLMYIVHPRLLVELGTHSGNSYCAFCQAIKELNIDAKCFTVDTWEGDVHAGFYGADVLADLRAHHDSLYGEFSRLVQSTFDEAVKYFSDGSIDLLHIDGLHTYDAVKHDFETWLAAASPAVLSGRSGYWNWIPTGTNIWLKRCTLRRPPIFLHQPAARSFRP